MSQPLFFLPPSFFKSRRTFWRCRATLSAADRKLDTEWLREGSFHIWSFLRNVCLRFLFRHLGSIKGPNFKRLWWIVSVCLFFENLIEACWCLTRITCRFRVQLASSGCCCTTQVKVTDFKIYITILLKLTFKFVFFYFLQNLGTASLI